MTSSKILLAGYSSSNRKKSEHIFFIEKSGITPIFDIEYVKIDLSKSSTGPFTYSAILV